MIKWVYGNTLPFAVPLTMFVKTRNGNERQDYTPPSGSTLQVTAVGKYKRKVYEYTIDGNVVYFTEDGTLTVGTYGIEIRVIEPSKRLRSFKCEELQIVNCSEDIDIGEFVVEGTMILDTTSYFWAKGDKGDAFTYEDFTPEQIATLQQPAIEAAYSVSEIEESISTNEQQRQQAEQRRVAAEEEREATFAGYNSLIDAKLDTISIEHFNNIFA